MPNRLFTFSDVSTSPRFLSRQLRARIPLRIALQRPPDFSPLAIGADRSALMLAMWEFVSARAFAFKFRRRNVPFAISPAHNAADYRVAFRGLADRAMSRGVCRLLLSPSLSLSLS